MMGLRERSSAVAMMAASSSSQEKERAELASPSQSLRAEKTSASWRYFLSALAALLDLSMRRSTSSRSDRMSSRSIMPMSRRGSVEPSTWMIFSSSKQRTTWTMEAHSRILARNLLPSPSPLLAPFTRPAMSTNSMIAGVVFLGR